MIHEEHVAYILSPQAIIPIYGLRVLCEVLMVPYSYMDSICSPRRGYWIYGTSKQYFLGWHTEAIWAIYYPSKLYGLWLFPIGHMVRACSHDEAYAIEGSRNLYKLHRIPEAMWTICSPKKIYKTCLVAGGYIEYICPRKPRGIYIAPCDHMADI